MAAKKRIQSRLDLVVSLAAALGLAGLGYAQGHSAEAKRPSLARLTPLDAAEVGIASWYGDPYHGRRTANGELYDMHLLTAAHRTMALPSYVRVTNLENERSVVLRVNDRGPFIDGRVIDVSYGAARALGFVRQGLTKVRIDPASPPQ